MKNRLVIIFLVLLVFMLNACLHNPNTSGDGFTSDELLSSTQRSNSDASNNDSNIVEPPKNTSTPPPQPLLFDSVNDAIAFITEPNLSDFYDGYYDAYQKMVATFQNDGYFTTVTHIIAAKLDNTVTLYPEVTYEDIGVHYYFRFNEELYQVVVYNVKAGDDYSVDLQTETVLDYYNKRWGDNISDVNSASTNHILLPSIFFTESGDDKICAQAMIDENHYVVIRAKRNAVSASELVEFIEGLVFDQTVLK